MTARELREGVFCVGAVDWDRRIFDELIPLPDGTSYNSYLVKGTEKTALIDTVDPTMEGVLLDNLRKLGVEKLDYVIANHAEQDHSGGLPAVLAAFPNAKAVCSPKCKDMLVDLRLAPPERLMMVNDGQAIALGGRTLEFHWAPWVHWPETMVTFLKEDKILFPCDMFGSHHATSDMYVTDEGATYEAAQRYYAEIMMPFRTTVRKNLEMVKGLKPEIIAPSHGPIHNKPSFIMNAYEDWTSEKVKNEVLVPYISMHGSTKAMVDYFVGALVKRGITVKQFNLSRTDIGKLAIALVDAPTMVVASPTVLAGPHPMAAYAAFLANALRPKLKYVSIIGSYGWGGKMVDSLAAMIPNLKVEVLKPVIIKGHPREDDYKALDALADEIAEKHKSLPSGVA